MDAFNNVYRRLTSRHKISTTVEHKNFNRGFKILHQDNGNADKANVSDSVPSEIKRLRFHDVKRKIHSVQPKLVSIYDIVEDCDRFKEERFKRMYIGRLLNSMIFRLTIMTVIIFNSIVIIIQTDRYLEEKFGTLFTVLDRIFLAVYVMEILLKWYYDFQNFWRVGWNLFDFVIVAASLLGPNLAIDSSENVFRVFRILRALRSLRSISALHGLQVIVHTIIHSIPDMANIVALLFICMFFFAVFSVSYFGDRCPKYFGTLGKALFSLFICVTQDGWIRIRDDLKTCGEDISGSIYLTLFIMVGAFVFANLVVAVVVTNMEWSIAEEKELERKCHKSKSDDPSDILHLVSHTQEPLLIPVIKPKVRDLEIYCLIIAQMQENLTEFKLIQKQLADILEEVRSLAQMDEETTEIGNIKVISSSTSRLKFNPLRDCPSHGGHRSQSIFIGDGISNLITRSRRHTVDAGSVQTLINHSYTTCTSASLIQPH